MAKVIFLDVDGVTCTARSHLALGYVKGDRIWKAWDDVACACIREVCKTGIQIVVSSTWRKPMHEADLKEKMAMHGLMPFVRMPDWKTPELNEGVRGHEIAYYLTHNPDIEDYRILDDNTDFLDSQSKHFIHTDPEEGMTYKNMRDLYRWARILNY